MSRTLVVVALLAAIVLPAAGALEIGDPAPKFANPDLGGTYVRHTGLIGTRWVIISFFATWCVPCKEELPELETLQREAGPERLAVLVFATDAERKDVAAYFAQRPTNTTVLLDPYQVTYARYNGEDNSLPTIFLVSPEGSIVIKHVGYSPDVIREIRGKILGAP